MWELSMYRSALATVACLCIYANLSGAAYSNSPKSFNHDVDLPSKDPLIIAHRGASGELPEHTVEAYRLAIEHGADVIECDVSVTKDLQLVCLHDSWLGTTTDAHDIFAKDRMRTYFIADNPRPGEITDYFAPDFTLAELKTLRKMERFDNRNRNNDGKFQIPTVEEYIGAAKTASPRVVGIAPEIKNPVFLNAHPSLVAAKTTVQELLLLLLEKHGYRSERDPCFVQSFHWGTIQEVAKLTRLPLVYLVRSNSEEITIEMLAEVAELCYAIGPDKKRIIQVNDNNLISGKTDFIANAHNVGLRVFPWTFRNDDEYLPWDYGKDPTFELLDFMRLETDGYFTDFPRTAKHVITSQTSAKQSTWCFSPLTLFIGD